MYSLDINFLNDRPDYKPIERTFISSRKTGAPVDRKPIMIGVLAALALNAAWAGAWLIFNGRNNQLQKELDALQAQLNERLQKFKHWIKSMPMLNKLMKKLMPSRCV
jgi:type IV pilus assembly protein PilN